MRRVVGKQVIEMSSEEFGWLRGDRPVLLDVGTGDGRHVVRLARQRPHWLVVGLDASRDQMRRTSATAAARPAKGGMPNALFVWASVEQLPDALRDMSEVHVLMPWGSLLRGIVGLDPAILRRLRAASAPGAQLLVTLNLHAWRPPVPEVGTTDEPDPRWARDELAGTYHTDGWRLDAADYLDTAQLDTLATSWGRRLGSSRNNLDVLALTATASE
ncbi:MAG: methyltransferase domain-containing protein [Pseudonocardiaceae bacterium]